MIKTKTKNKETGSSMYFAMMVLTVTLGVVLGLTTIVVSQIKMVRSMHYSVIAYYAADSGIEEALRDLFKGDGLPAPTRNGSGSVGDASFNYTIYNSSDDSCDKQYYCIKSMGEYKNIKRAIEVGR